MLGITNVHHNMQDGKNIVLFFYMYRVVKTCCCFLMYIS